MQKARSQVSPSHGPFQASLNNQSLLEGITYLREIDPDLRKIVSDLGNPPLCSRKPGFPTLIHIILEQQVSLSSAKAAFQKLESAAGSLTPEQFIQFDDSELRRFGFSRQKANYGRVLSQALIDGWLNLEKLPDMDDRAARSTLMKVKGIGPWTADIYLLMVLLRPDIWPSGDLALAQAIQNVKRLPERPNLRKLDEIAEHWKPFRAVAARILWHAYLNYP
jgi:DNA-3-methyladenine glycosylase II